jgi:hypothetical protein
MQSEMRRRDLLAGVPMNTLLVDFDENAEDDCRNNKIEENVKKLEMVERIVRFIILLLLATCFEPV